jgi:membrane protease YdiL (CAAX protease family)
LPTLLRHLGAAAGLYEAWPVALAGYLLLAAPLEEAFFRGALFNALEAWACPLPAVVGSAAAFAVVHVPGYGPAALVPDFLAGLLLGWLRWLSGGLAAPVLAHALADFLEMP